MSSRSSSVRKSSARWPDTLPGSGCPDIGGRSSPAGSGAGLGGLRRNRLCRNRPHTGGERQCFSFSARAWPRLSPRSCEPPAPPPAEGPNGPRPAPAPPPGGRFSPARVGRWPLSSMLRRSCRAVPTRAGKGSAFPSPPGPPWPRPSPRSCGNRSLSPSGRALASVGKAEPVNRARSLTGGFRTLPRGRHAGPAPWLPGSQPVAQDRDQRQVGRGHGIVA